jgi:Trk K+ transport system NAD-binding subunit
MQQAKSPISSTNPTDFLVCGLGSLGQHCVVALKEFGVTVRAIDLTDKEYWNIPKLPDLLDQLLIGDCRYPKTLEAAALDQCRAVLLLTNNERINIEAAFAVRSLNPTVRIVIRSAQDKLNVLLAQQLGNFVAFEAAQLSATAFALAALGGETCGLFKLGTHIFRVVQVQIDPTHSWCDYRKLAELNTPTCQVLSHAPKDSSLEAGFYQWEPESTVRNGDVIAYVEVSTPSSSTTLPRTPSFRQQLLDNLAEKRLWPADFWHGNQTQRVILLCTGVMLVLFLVGTLLYKLNYPDIGWQDALNVGIVLAIGGFDNLFGQLKLPFPIPWWLHLYSIALTVAGTVFIGILYASLTERVLAARFEFLRRRPPIPRQDHVVLVGLGKVGQRVAKLLLDLKQSLVGINGTILDPENLSQMPLIVGNWNSAFERVNLKTARSLIAVTDDEVANLEIALMAHATNPKLNLVICTFDSLFTENVAQLLPYTRVLGTYALAAEAYAGAAFGENILELLHLNNQTILVTEYRIEKADSLNGLLVAEVAYGYGVVPILHQRETRDSVRLMPSPEMRLQEGDRLVVFANMEGLRRIEQGLSLARQWQVQIEKAFSAEAAFEGGMAVVRVTGCDISTAKASMNQLPGMLPCLLYKHQALRLIHELSKVRVSAHLMPTTAHSEMMS